MMETDCFNQHYNTHTETNKDAKVPRHGFLAQRSNGWVRVPNQGGRSPHHEARLELGCSIKDGPNKNK